MTDTFLCSAKSFGDLLKAIYTLNRIISLRLIGIMNLQGIIILMYSGFSWSVSTWGVPTEGAGSLYLKQRPLLVPPTY